MRALVIGSHGFIGSRVVDQLAKQGVQVYGVDSLSVYKPKNIKQYYLNLLYKNENLVDKLSGFKRINLTDSHQVNELLNEFKPTHIINCAGISVADVCAENINEAVSSIYLLNSAILQAIKNDSNIERYVYLSSSMIYGDFGTNFPDENSLPNPKDPYGAIKLGGESLIRSFNAQWQLPFTIIRPSAVYGPLDSNLRVTGIFMEKAAKGQTLVVADQNESLDFTYVEDTVKGIMSVLNNSTALNETFNISRGESRTILDLAKLITKHYPKSKIQIGGNVEFMPGLERPKRGSLNINKARELLNYKPTFDLEAGIEEYVKFWNKTY